MIVGEVYPPFTYKLHRLGMLFACLFICALFKFLTVWTVRPSTTNNRSEKSYSFFGEELRRVIKNREEKS